MNRHTPEAMTDRSFWYLYVAPCTNYVGRHRLGNNWALKVYRWLPGDIQQGPSAFTVNIDGGAFH